jgi:uncharacterized damage-inducible protein DinB
MEGLIDYRRRLVERLAQAAREFCEACEAGPSGEAVEGGWSLHQMAAHVRDVDRAVYGARVRRTLQEQEPLFQSFDADAWMEDHYRPDESLREILADFKAGVEDLCALLDAMPQSGWSRLSRHETMGEGLTLQSWVERSLAHVEEHRSGIAKSA